MTDLSPERQRELLAAIGVSVTKLTLDDGYTEWQICQQGLLEDDGFMSELEAWAQAWKYYDDEALAHDWHAQAARIAALEAQLASRKQADDLVDALAGDWPIMDVAVMNAHVGETASGAVEHILLAARRAKAAREQAVQDA